MKKTIQSKFDETHFGLLEKLSNAGGVSGNENEVRKLIIDEIKESVDQYRTDSMGNLLAVKKSTGKTMLRVMVAAHMDEVGFMITDKGDNGLYRFDGVGGIPASQVVGKPVLIGKDRIPGVIGTKPIHMVKKEELNQPISLENLRIDIGMEAKADVNPGDFVVFGTQFQRVSHSMIGKAMDDRLGVASLIFMLKDAFESIELLGAFTVQEELGLRGAGAAAYGLMPDAAVVMDSTPANDFPAWDGSENTQYNTRLDHGPAIYVESGEILSDPRLVRHFIQTADKREIPYQIRQPGGGRTDAGAIFIRRTGIPTISISVPTRYLHSPASLVRISDWEYTYKLVRLGLETLSPEVLKRP